MTIEIASESSLGDYVFGSGIISHKFCKACGSSVFFEFTNAKDQTQMPDVVGVNVSLPAPGAVVQPPWSSYLGDHLSNGVA